MNDEEFEDMIRRFTPAFEEGFIAGRLGLPGDLTLGTKWGPIEGTRDGNTIRWTFPNHEWLEVRLGAAGAMEIYRNDKLWARTGPAGLVEDDPEDDEGEIPPT